MVCGVCAAGIPYENMPDPRDLLELCSSIRIAQSETYEGHYADEQKLFGLLRDIFRSPDMLFRVTKEKSE